MGIVEVGFYFLLEILASFFRHTDLSRYEISKKNFFSIQILGIIEKCIGCFLVYLFLGGVFLLKVQERCVYVFMLFLVLVHLKVCFLMGKKGISGWMS